MQKMDGQTESQTDTRVMTLQIDLFYIKQSNM